MIKYFEYPVASFGNNGSMTLPILNINLLELVDGFLHTLWDRQNFVTKDNCVTWLRLIESLSELFCHILKLGPPHHRAFL